MMRQLSITVAMVLALASTGALAAKHATSKAADVKSTDVRDWSKIDPNHDNLVSPDEMEKFLAANSAAKKAATK